MNVQAHKGAHAFLQLVPILELPRRADEATGPLALVS
jgi:hypothetical protein